MNNHNIKQGKSNIVTYDVQKDSHALLHKFFAPKLVCYDVLWPMSRMQIEGACLDLLQTVLDDNPYVAAPVHFSSFDTETSIAMEFIEGISLFDILSNPSASSYAIPSKEQLCFLLLALRKTSSVSLTDFPLDIQSIFLDQLEIVKCMYQNKLKNQVPVPSTDSRFFCLGDVSLNNILFDGHSFTLIDLECAHFGYEGYDTCQLLGMTKAYANSSKQFELFYHNLLSAFQHTYSPAKQKQFETLTDLFYSYYKED